MTDAPAPLRPLRMARRQLLLVGVAAVIGLVAVLTAAAGGMSGPGDGLVLLAGLALLGVAVSSGRSVVRRTRLAARVERGEGARTVVRRLTVVRADRLSAVLADPGVEAVLTGGPPTSLVMERHNNRIAAQVTAVLGVRDGPSGRWRWYSGDQVATNLAAQPRWRDTRLETVEHDGLLAYRRVGAPWGGVAVAADPPGPVRREAVVMPFRWLAVVVALVVGLLGDALVAAEAAGSSLVPLLGVTVLVPLAVLLLVGVARWDAATVARGRGRELPELLPIAELRGVTDDLPLWRMALVPAGSLLVAAVLPLTGALGLVAGAGALALELRARRVAERG